MPTLSNFTWLGIKEIKLGTGWGLSQYNICCFSNEKFSLDNGQWKLRCFRNVKVYKKISTFTWEILRASKNSIREFLSLKKSKTYFYTVVFSVKSSIEVDLQTVDFLVSLSRRKNWMILCNSETFFGTVGQKIHLTIIGVI